MPPSARLVPKIGSNTAQLLWSLSETRERLAILDPAVTKRLDRTFFEALRRCSNAGSSSTSDDFGASVSVTVDTKSWEALIDVETAEAASGEKGKRNRQTKSGSESSEVLADVMTLLIEGRTALLRTRQLGNSTTTQSTALSAVAHSRAPTGGSSLNLIPFCA